MGATLDNGKRQRASGARGQKSLNFLQQSVEMWVLKSAGEGSGRGEERGKLILPYTHIICRMLLEM